jgi:hypothetical protein
LICIKPGPCLDENDGRAILRADTADGTMKRVLFALLLGACLVAPAAYAGEDDTEDAAQAAQSRSQTHCAMRAWNCPA